ncbi:CPBP family intramembrane glutamic endopeptidase [Paludisphaera rhizosphaerae]|uniref:CPBP family intramembrane glutamic endopeptidase n=1 Tax=Paludisphaera rhizosphaerae TaxID=2711216 RepID=UPI0013EDB590|nr:CPBP family intramembrane glutamic endopeptidase [Paludisphaera rhizosphaerae]
MPAAALLGLAILLVAWNAVLVFLAFRDPERWFQPAWRLAEESGGLVNLTLSANLLNFALFVVGLLMIGFRQQPHMLGLDPRHIPAGVAVTALIFAMQLAAEAAAAWSQGEPLALSAAWSGKTWTVAAGLWIAQLFGNALFEEVVYRGFFLPQAYFLAARLPESRPATRLAFALALSQGVFAAIHIPVNVAHHISAIFLLVQFAIGLVLAGVYLASNNLFLAVGIHTLLNEPPSPIASPLPEGVAPGLLTLGLLAVLILRCSRTGSRMEEPPERGRALAETA